MDLLGYNLCSRACCVFRAGFSLGLLFNTEDERNAFLRNVAWLSTDYTPYIPEDRTLRNPRCETLKSYTGSELEVSTDAKFARVLSSTRDDHSRSRWCSWVTNLVLERVNSDESCHMARDPCEKRRTYKWLWGSSYLHLYRTSTLKMDAEASSETLMPTRLHGVTSQRE